DQPSGIRTWRANVVITAVGIFSRPNVPAFRGIDEFNGRWFHSARWPDDLDLAGKRIAVIGSGCSAYQMLPEIVDTAAHTYLFQRTASWVVGTPGYLDLTTDEVAWLDRNLPYHMNWARFRHSWGYRPDALDAMFTVDPTYSDPVALSETNRQVREA